MTAVAVFFMIVILLLGLYLCALTGLLGKTIQFISMRPSFDPGTDECIARALDSLVGAQLTRHTMAISTESGKIVEVWMSNKWYGYGSLWDGSSNQDARPSIKTFKRLRALENTTRANGGRYMRDTEEREVNETA